MVGNPNKNGNQNVRSHSVVFQMIPVGATFSVVELEVAFISHLQRFHPQSIECRKPERRKRGGGGRKDVFGLASKGPKQNPRGTRNKVYNNLNWLARTEIQYLYFFAETVPFNQQHRQFPSESIQGVQKWLVVDGSTSQVQHRQGSTTPSLSMLQTTQFAQECFKIDDPLSFSHFQK